MSSRFRADSQSPRRPAARWSWPLLCGVWMLLAACDRVREDDVLSALSAVQPVGIALVVQASDCTARQNELRLIRHQMPQVTLVVLAADDTQASVPEELIAIFPDAGKRAIVTRSRTTLVRAGVSSTPALIEWSAEDERVTGSPLSFNWDVLRRQVIGATATYNAMRRERSGAHRDS